MIRKNHYDSVSTRAIVSGKTKLRLLAKAAARAVGKTGGGGRTDSKGSAVLGGCRGSCLKGLADSRHTERQQRSHPGAFEPIQIKGLVDYRCS